MTKRTYRQNTETGKFYEVTRTPRTRQSIIQVSHVDFVSPVDGSHIRNSRELVEHNKRHGVSNDLDSLREQTARAQEKTPFSRRERRDAIADSIERASSSGYSRRVPYDE